MYIVEFISARVRARDCGSSCIKCRKYRVKLKAIKIQTDKHYKLYVISVFPNSIDTNMFR